MIIRRAIIKKVEASINRDILTVLIGARQVGKTSILLYLKELLEKKGEKVLYFDLEHLAEREAFNSTSEALKYLKESGVSEGRKNYVFLDEIQYLENPSNLLKVIYDHYKQIKLVVSGSSTLQIKDKFKDSLSGRKEIITIYPLSFSEYLLFSGEEDLAGAKDGFSLNGILDNGVIPEVSVVMKERLARCFDSFVVYGGYPKAALTVVRDEKISIIRDILDSYILKDIKDFAHVGDVRKFNQAVRFLAVQNTGLFNAVDASREIGVSRDTLNKYIFILENTFGVYLLAPYHTNRQKEITKMQKVFFVDTGLRNFLLKDFNDLILRTDAGELVENTVLNEIRRQSGVLDEVYFWRTPQKAEVDCIIRREGGKIIPIEIKYKIFNSPQMPAGLKAFIRKYKPAKAVIITRNFASCFEFLGTKVLFFPQWMV